MQLLSTPLEMYLEHQVEVTSIDVSFFFTIILFIFFAVGGEPIKNGTAFHRKSFHGFLAGWWFKFTNYFSRNLEVFARSDKGLFTLYVITLPS